MKIYACLLLLFVTRTAHPQQPRPEYRQGETRPMIPYRKGALWGYAGTEGNLLVVPQFEEAGFLISGRARVRIKGKYGFLNASGNYAINPEYDAATEFDEYAKVTKDGQTFFIDRSGYPVSGETVGDRGVACGGVITRMSWFHRYTRAEKIGLLVKKRSVFDSLAGKRTIRYDTLPGLFDETRENGKGLVAVRVGQQWGMLNQEGQFVLPLEYDEIGFNPYPRGEPVQFYGKIQKSGLWGLVNEKGAVVVAPKYESLEQCSQGIFRVKPVGRAAGYMDKAGLEFFED